MDNVLEYENLIYKMISKYKNFDQEDLYQVAMLGLMNAKRNYKPDENTKFSTYAYYYILGEINTYIKASNPVKISQDLLRLKGSLTHAKEVMTQRLRREPTIEELSVFLEVPMDKIEEAMIATSAVESLDYTYDDENDLYNSFGQPETQMTEDFLDLKNAVQNLPKEEQALIVARYYEGLTQQETSETLGMSQVQVSRKELKILQKLKTSL
ncbi:MAG: sigma-70 family RNA polymerase sigma factor [Candidatus Faecimonas sp.]|nr:sigma-70 family RNA polymerase sigma factor [Mycoplasmatota bacterium]MDY2908597.1 sigma-70 family RNA polymerase sigma factor [Candidatus Faecimonas sp.]